MAKKFKRLTHQYDKITKQPGAYLHDLQRLAYQKKMISAPNCASLHVQSTKQPVEMDNKTRWIDILPILYVYDDSPNALTQKYGCALHYAITYTSKIVGFFLVTYGKVSYTIYIYIDKPYRRMGFATTALKRFLPYLKAAAAASTGLPPVVVAVEVKRPLEKAIAIEAGFKDWDPSLKASTLSIDLSDVKILRKEQINPEPITYLDVEDDTPKELAFQLWMQKRPLKHTEFFFKKAYSPSQIVLNNYLYIDREGNFKARSPLKEYSRVRK